jgi:hypothetical protein
MFGGMNFWDVMFRGETIGKMYRNRTCCEHRGNWQPFKTKHLNGNGDLLKILTGGTKYVEAKPLGTKSPKAKIVGNKI